MQAVRMRVKGPVRMRVKGPVRMRVKAYSKALL